MRRQLMTVALAVLLAMVAGISVVSASAWSTSTERATRLTEKVNERKALDLGDPGSSVGDQFYFNGDVLNDRGTRIGRSGGTSHVVQILPSGPLIQVLATLDLPEGQVVLGGAVELVPFREGRLPGNFAILGGTGAYRNARGYATAVHKGPDVREAELRVITGDE